MLIKFEDPMAIDGLLEDINTSYLDPGSVVGMVHDQIRRIQDGGSGTYEDLYRTFNKHLRAIATSNSPYKESAQRLIKRLPLLQTLPLGELECPDYVDEYTGIEQSREWFEDDIEMSDKEEDVRRDTSKLSASMSEWNHYLAHRKPYSSDEDNRAFLLANVEWIGAETDELPLDDRGYIPAHFTTEGRADKQLREVFAQCSDAISNLREVIAESISLFGTDDRSAPTKVRQRVQSSPAAIDFLQTLQTLITEGANPANVATVFLRYQHGYAFCGPGTWTRDPDGKSHLHDPSPYIHASTILLEDNTTLEEYIEEYEDELMSGVEACGPVDNDHMTDQEIETSIDILFKEYIDGIEEQPINPRHSRAWVLGFILAVENGIPMRRSPTVDYTASDAAWDNWRKSTSPDGDAAYHRALKNGATRRAAMRCFYGTARQKGEVRPSQPKRIKAIRAHGLVLTNSKFVSWSVAHRINNEEGFELSTADRSRLKGILIEQGWGAGFTEVL